MKLTAWAAPADAISGAMVVISTSHRPTRRLARHPSRNLSTLRVTTRHDDAELHDVIPLWASDVGSSVAAKAEEKLPRRRYQRRHLQNNRRPARPWRPPWQSPNGGRMGCRSKRARPSRVRVGGNLATESTLKHEEGPLTKKDILGYSFADRSPGCHRGCHPVRRDRPPQLCCSAPSASIAKSVPCVSVVTKLTHRAHRGPARPAVSPPHVISLLQASDRGVAALGSPTQFMSRSGCPSAAATTSADTLRAAPNELPIALCGVVRERDLPRTLAAKAGSRSPQALPTNTSG